MHSRVRPPESLAACDAGPAVGAATGAQHVGCPDWPTALGARMLAGVAAPAITRRAKERRSAGGTGSLRGLVFAARLHVATKSVTAVLAGPLPAAAKAATVLPPLVGHPATSARPRGQPAVQALQEHASEDRTTRLAFAFRCPASWACDLPAPEHIAAVGADSLLRPAGVAITAIAREHPATRLARVRVVRRSAQGNGRLTTGAGNGSPGMHDTPGSSLRGC